MKDNSKKKKIIKLATDLASISLATGLTSDLAITSSLVAYRMIKHSKKNIAIKKVDYSKFNALHEEIEKALQRSQEGDYDSTILCARRAFEKTLKLIIENAGYEPTNEMFENLNICEDKRLLNNELIRNLHKVRMICNKNIHEIEAKLSKEDIDFVITQIQNLLKEAEKK